MRRNVDHSQGGNDAGCRTERIRGHNGISAGLIGGNDVDIQEVVGGVRNFYPIEAPLESGGRACANANEERHPIASLNILADRLLHDFRRLLVKSQVGHDARNCAIIVHRNHGIGARISLGDLI